MYIDICSSWDWGSDCSRKGSRRAAMRAVSMENSGRWAVAGGRYPTPLPSHSTVIRLRDSFACSLGTWRDSNGSDCGDQRETRVVVQFYPLFGFRNKNRVSRAKLREACTIHGERGVSHAGTKVLGYKAAEPPLGSACYPYPGNFSNRSVSSPARAIFLTTKRAERRSRMYTPVYLRPID
jgi:hypothetical protein